MGDKSLQKKQYIVENARKIFAKKGFAAVTMKDVVEGCGISRGGLYIYFDSVEGIFEEVIKEELNKDDSDAFKNFSDAFTQTDLLKIYMKEQKKEILLSEDCLITALYEYGFIQKEKLAGADSKVVKGYSNRVTGSPQLLMDELIKNKMMFLETILKKGSENGEFNVDYPRNTARNIVYAFEGLKVLGRIATVTEKMVDDELTFLLKGILV